MLPLPRGANAIRC
ncbi:hypothetical protein B4923_14260 [Brenneria roseae subsp. americana]|uniref:Uncharacterized protein n=1 Tax=Brenneria roseae subsp. americana TaxID=1508507 RepID=A0A2U1TP76_9GAMM|nr:hypothetical protein B4923_14260 [Brenneria roseae subsp. americana]PWC23103.1 hypothetical protein DDT52_00135 [Brenneria roseae subsp. roseae]